MPSRFVVEPRQFSVMVYSDGTVNYDASCNVFKYGDRGFMYSMSGPKFYLPWREEGVLQSLFDKLGVRTLEGYVTPHHARLLKMVLRPVGNVEVTEKGKMSGHDMVWAVVTVKDKENE